MRRTTFSLAALAFVAIAPVASAQGNQSIMSRFTLDVATGTTTVDASDDLAKTKMGIGYGLQLGFDVMPALKIVAGWDAAKIDIDEEGAEGDFGLSQFDIGARYSFMNVSPKFRPYLQASVTPRSFASDLENPETGETAELTFSGMGYSFGGGLDYVLSPKLAIMGGLTYTTGSFDKVELDGEEADLEGDEAIDANGMRVRVGLSWRPFQGR